MFENLSNTTIAVVGGAATGAALANQAKKNYAAEQALLPGVGESCPSYKCKASLSCYKNSCVEKLNPGECLSYMDCPSSTEYCSDSRNGGVCTPKTAEMLAQEQENSNTAVKVLKIIGIIVGSIIFLMIMLYLGKMYLPKYFSWYPYGQSQDY